MFLTFAGDRRYDPGRWDDQRTAQGRRCGRTLDRAAARATKHMQTEKRSAETEAAALATLIEPAPGSAPQAASRRSRTGALRTIRRRRD